MDSHSFDETRFYRVFFPVQGARASPISLNHLVVAISVYLEENSHGW